MGYRILKKNCDDILSRFHLIPERNGQTDGRTDSFAISYRASKTDRHVFISNNECICKAQNRPEWSSAALEGRYFIIYICIHQYKHTNKKQYKNTLTTHYVHSQSITIFTKLLTEFSYLLMNF